jgi:large subunit ribosomal protein L25
MEHILPATQRKHSGTGPARAERRAQNIPAVVYGGQLPNELISLDRKTIQRLIDEGHFLTTVFSLDMNGKSVRAIPRDYQVDPVTDVPIHVDFLRIAHDSMVRVDVPIEFINHEASPGLRGGGVLTVVHHTVTLSVPADHIPESVEVDLTGLELGVAIHGSALHLPKGGTLVTHDPNFTLATIALPSKLEVESPIPAAEGENSESAAASSSAKDKDKK